MKIVSVAILIVALFVASVTMTIVSVLSDLGQPRDDIRMEDLMAGQLLPLLTGPTLWSRYVSFPSVTALTDAYTMVLVGGLVAATVYLLRIRWRMPLGLVSAAVLLLGAVPYAQGLFVLQTIQAAPRECGTWIAVMVLGVFHASQAATLLAVADLTGWHQRALASLKHVWSRASFHFQGARFSTDFQSHLA